MCSNVLFFTCHAHNCLNRIHFEESRISKLIYTQLRFHSWACFDDTSRSWRSCHFWRSTWQNGSGYKALMIKFVRRVRHQFVLSKIKFYFIYLTKPDCVWLREFRNWEGTMGKWSLLMSWSMVVVLTSYNGMITVFPYMSKWYSIYKLI